MSDRHILILMDRWPSGAAAQPQPRDPDARRVSRRRLRIRIGDALIAIGARLSSPPAPAPHGNAAGARPGVLAARPRPPG